MKSLVDAWLFLRRLGGLIWLAGRLTLLRSGRPEERFRLFFEQAGGGFVKLGQILALRYDLLPPSYTSELLRLLSRVPALPFDAVEPVFVAERGEKPSRYFRRFNPQPVASASISQVYRATLHSGEEVAVKIKRPGVDEAFATDFALASFLAGLIGLLGIFRAVSLEEVVAEFVLWTKRELDFTYEADNGLVLREHSRYHPNTVVPKVYREHSGPRVLVTEFMTGIYRLDAVIEHLDKNPNFRFDLLTKRRIDLSQLAYYFIIDGMRQYFIDGFFHADPHPANVFLLPDNRLGYFDFGIMGRVDGRRLELLKIIHSITERDLQSVSQAFLAYSKRSLNEEIEVFKRGRRADYARYARVLAKIEEIIADNFREELAVILAPWYAAEAGVTQSSPSASAIFSRLLFRAENYSVYVPREMVIFFRGLIISDMVALKLEPNFQMIRAFKLFFREFPLTRAEEIIRERTHEEELEGGVEVVTDLDYEQLMELKQAERERLNLAAERLSDLVLYYAENYEEVRKML